LGRFSLVQLDDLSVQFAAPAIFFCDYVGILHFFSLNLQIKSVGMPTVSTNQAYRQPQHLW
ncbi:MAG: hypothetical protein Q4C37_11525, partial [Bacteroidales bacterium]|nr:hypothetical protein [Bacteroidales bacterium]